MGKVQVKKVEVPQCGKLTCDFCLQDFVASQVQLDPDAERALRTNLWDLYDGDEYLRRATVAIERQDRVFAER